MDNPPDGSVHLRRAGLADAGAIANVHVRTWQRAYAAMLPADLLRQLNVGKREMGWRHAIAEADEDRRPWVAQCDTRVVGFVSMGASRDNDSDPQTGEVYAIYVDPDYWSRGVGTKLMAQAVDDLQCKGYAMATLWVLVANSRARVFYEAIGWTSDNTMRTETIEGSALVEMRYRTVLR